MNKKCRPVTQEELKQIVEMLRKGFEYDGHLIRSKKQIADVLILEANLGIRVEDVLSLRLCDFKRDGENYRIDIVEKKTKKPRQFIVPSEIMDYIKDYAILYGIKSQQQLFPFRERNVQKYLKMVCDLVGLQKIGTHSFRKFYATEIYYNNSNDIRLVQILLQHSNVAVTQRYVGVDNEKIETAILGNVNLV